MTKKKLIRTAFRKRFGMNIFQEMTPDQRRAFAVVEAYFFRFPTWPAIPKLDIPVVVLNAAVALDGFLEATGREKLSIWIKDFYFENVTFHDGALVLTLDGEIVPAR
ncbi:MAG: hypothetical protein AB2L13_10590 [Spirochaetota bacterium]